jgi:predicted nucleic-acid-binding protein
MMEPSSATPEPFIAAGRMVGLDTNVIVRYIAQDDEQQSRLASQVIDACSASQPGFINLICLIEMVWVMQKCYGAEREEICQILTSLLRTQELVVENAAIVSQAIRLYNKTNADFADCLIARSNHAANCHTTYTFDRTAARDCKMQLLA